MPETAARSIDFLRLGERTRRGGEYNMSQNMTQINVISMLTSADPPPKDAVIIHRLVRCCV